MSELVEKKVMDRGMLPAYIWKSGRTFFLSKAEKVVADCYLETHNVAECVRALEREGMGGSWGACKSWMELEHVKEYLAEKIEDSGVYAGWTKEHWVKVMTDHLMGVKRLGSGDLYGMKLMAELMGWQSPQVGVFNQQINFTQMSGKA